MGPWRFEGRREGRRARFTAPAGLRIFLWLPDSRPRAQLLPRLLVAKRIQGAACERPVIESGVQGLVAEKKVDYAHDLLAKDSLKFVRDHKDQPFFLFLAFTIPHANDEAGDKGMEVPDLGEYANLVWPEPQKGHAAMITRMDGDIGRLLALVQELKIDDNTLIIFSSDNGPHKEGGCDPKFNNSSGPLRGMKGDLWEGGIRVPMIARWPGHVAAGKTSESPVYFADVLPTLAV